MKYKFIILLGIITLACTSSNKSASQLWKEGKEFRVEDNLKASIKTSTPFTGTKFATVMIIRSLSEIPHFFWTLIFLDWEDFKISKARGFFGS